MNNIRIKVIYDGTMFLGWQRQDKGRTVQGEIEKVLKSIFNERITIHGSGRTDRGVHSCGQVASFECELKFTTETLFKIMNDRLPSEIFIAELEEMDDGFHARYSAVGKHYCYKIFNGERRSPFLSNSHYHVKYPLDIEAMEKAAAQLVGRKDFRSFMASGSGKENTIREIYDVEFSVHDTHIEINFKGNGFLYNMVRIMVGMLIDIGLGKLDPSAVHGLIEARDRTKLRHTAPAHGLYLMEVFY